MRRRRAQRLVVGRRAAALRARPRQRRARWLLHKASSVVSTFVKFDRSAPQQHTTHASGGWKGAHKLALSHPPITPTRIRYARMVDESTCVSKTEDYLCVDIHCADELIQLTGRGKRARKVSCLARERGTDWRLLRACCVRTCTCVWSWCFTRAAGAGVVLRSSQRRVRAGRRGRGRAAPISCRARDS